MEVPSFTSLEIELLRYGFRKIYFLETDCLACGTWRIAQDGVFEPGNTVPGCPQCSGRVQVSPVLCWGFTRREMPIVEKVKAGLSVNALAWINARIDDDERDRRRIAKERAGSNGRHLRKDRKINPDDFKGVPQYAP
jgi:hypothetical protein